MKRTALILAGFFALVYAANAQWTLLTSGKTNNFLSVHFTDANTGYVVGEDDGMGSGGIIMKTTNGGVNWSTQVSNTFSILNDVYFTDAMNGYITGGSGTILKTMNGGTIVLPIL